VIVPRPKPTQEQEQILKILNCSVETDLPENYIYIRESDLTNLKDYNKYYGPEPMRLKTKVTEFESENGLFISKWGGSFLPDYVEQAIELLENPDQIIVKGSEMTLCYTTHTDVLFGKKIQSDTNVFTVSDIFREASQMYPLLGGYVDERYRGDYFWLTYKLHIDAENKQVILCTEA
jgi:hypothetical protein